MKDFEHAIADETKANELVPTAAQPICVRGMAYIGASNFDQAIADFNAVIKIDPKSAYGLYGRGTARLKKGDTAGGNADIAAATALKTGVAGEWADPVRIRCS
jgi:lipoprotein NlpI